ncbi:MAG: transcriptional regulator GcvA [Betaproteobacteria bacterium]|nr:transcriptional regulator GcvA [Betaproteobacteria bacterium]
MKRMHRRRDLPSLDLLKGFEAAARHLSFTKAGAELFLSQSAVSRQIQQLEEQLGVPLFFRRTRALLLTDAGQRYFRDVGQVLQQLREATARLDAASQGRAVTVTTTVTFASLWLVPRLADFQERHPEIAVHVAADNAIRDLEQERLDVSIRYATRRLAGRGAVKLFGERVVPVCSPKLLAKRALDRPEDLEHFVLLHFEDPEHSTPWLSWDVWFEVMKMKRVAGKGMLRFSHYDQLLRAAINGQGVALGRLPLIGGLLKEGTLVTPFRAARYSTRSEDRAYWLVAAPSAHARPEVQTFVQWVREQAATMTTREK